MDQLTGAAVLLALVALGVGIRVEAFAHDLARLHRRVDALFAFEWEPDVAPDAMAEEKRPEHEHVRNQIAALVEAGKGESPRAQALRDRLAKA